MSQTTNQKSRSAKFQTTQPSQVDLRETAYNYIAGEKTGTFFTGEQKWINRIKKFAQEYPDEIIITHTNQEDGSIVASVPIKWFKISPPRKVSDAQKEAASKRFKKMWEEKNRSKSDNS